MMKFNNVYIVRCPGHDATVEVRVLGDCGRPHGDQHVLPGSWQRRGAGLEHARDARRAGAQETESQQVGLLVEYTYKGLLQIGGFKGEVNFQGLVYLQGWTVGILE